MNEKEATQITDAHDSLADQKEKPSYAEKIEYWEGRIKEAEERGARSIIKYLQKEYKLWQCYDDREYTKAEIEEFIEDWKNKDENART